MALEFLHRTQLDGIHRTPKRIAMFPGAWNPPTIAHAGIARAALGWAEEVVWVLPRAFPHKSFDGAPFDQRCAFIAEIARSQPGFSAAISAEGLYADIAREAREHFGPETEIALVCGRDAADRIANWDYGAAGVFEQMLVEYPLLVASRAGEYAPPAQHRERIVRLALPPLDDVSSTEVRRRIAGSEPWRHLVPAPITEVVAELYALDS